MVKQIDTKAAFDEVLKGAAGKCVFVDFTATWCGPCKTIGPVFEKLATENEDCIFVKVDVDENAEVAELYKISAMPTFMVFKDGQKVGEMVGASEEKLKELVAKNK